MPTYVYQCATCGRFELKQSFAEAALTTCPTCDLPVRRVISPAPILFKGSGWYSTDSRGSSSKAVDDDAKNGSEKNGSDTKTEDKSDSAKSDNAKTDGAKTEKAETKAEKAETTSTKSEATADTKA